MRSRLVILTAFAALLFLAPARASAFGVNDVIKLQKQGVSDSLIVLAIQNSHQVIHVSSDDFRKLKQAGTSDDVMSALLHTEQMGFQKNAENHTGVNAYGWAYYPYGGYYPYAYPRSSLSLSFSYGYGGFLWPYYRPYYYRPFYYRPFYRPFVGIHVRRW